MFFFFNDPATTEIYTLSLHDALPISRNSVQKRRKIWCRSARCFFTSPTSRLSSLGPTISEVKDRKSTRLNSSHPSISYAVFCLKKKKIRYAQIQPYYYAHMPPTNCLR